MLTAFLFAQSCVCRMHLVHHISLLYVRINSIILYKLRYSSIYILYVIVCKLNLLNTNFLYPPKNSCTSKHGKSIVTQEFLVFVFFFQISEKIAQSLSLAFLFSWINFIALFAFNEFQQQPQLVISCSKLILLSLTSKNCASHCIVKMVQLELLRSVKWVTEKLPTMFDSVMS